MAVKPILDNFAYCLIGFACGAVVMFCVALFGWDPRYLALCWIVMAVGWVIGRIDWGQRGSRNHPWE